MIDSQAQRARSDGPYTFFKWLVALILFLMLLFLWPTLFSGGGGPAPTLRQPAAGSATAGPVTFSGVAEPNAEVQVLVDGQPVGKTRAGADGSWSLAATVDRPGQHAIVVQTLTAAGAVASASAPTSLDFAAGAAAKPAAPAAPPTAAPTTAPAAPTVAPTVAAPTAAPAAPTAAPAKAAVVPSLRQPAAGSATAGPVTFSGVAEPNAEVQVLVDGQPVGKTRAGADGSWSLAATVDRPGQHAIIVQALTAAGAVASASAPTSLDFAAGAAAKPAAPATAAPPTLDLPANASLSGSPVTLNGTGTAGQRVEVVVDGQPVGTATVGADGKWSLPVTVAAGDHEIILRALGADGARVAVADAKKVTVAAAAPSISQPAGGATVEAGELQIAGKAAPGSEIEILDGDTVLGTVKAGSDGAWSFTARLEAGARNLKARPVGNAAAASQPVAVTVNAPPAPPAAAAGANDGNIVPGCGPGGIDRGRTWLVARCDTLSWISVRTGISMQALMRANPQITDPNLIFAGSSLVLPGRR